MAIHIKLDSFLDGHDSSGQHQGRPDVPDLQQRGPGDLCRRDSTPRAEQVAALGDAVIGEVRGR